jgi:DNA-binding protein HU-beta
MPIGKHYLVDAIARGAGCTNAKAEAALSEMVDLMSRGIVEGHEVIIRGFGTFKALATPERTARNPKTGGSIAVPAGRRVKFKPSSKLKELL